MGPALAAGLGVAVLMERILPPMGYIQLTPQLIITTIGVVGLARFELLLEKKHR